MMSEKGFKTKYYLKSRQGIILGVVKVNEEDNVLYWNKVVDLLNGLTEENEQLKQELQGMNELLQSYRQTIKHDAELLADASKNGYLPLLNVEETIENKKNCVLNKYGKSLPCKAYDECLKRQGTNKPLPCMVNWMMGRTFENMLRKEGDDE